MNILKIRCSKCGDILTDGEVRTNGFKPEFQQRTPVCYQCAMSAKYDRPRNSREQMIEDKMDEIQDQGQRWGEPKGGNHS